MIDAIEDVFERYDEESHKFERVQHKFSNRPDVHAFILLDTLFPGNRDLVSAACHDQIYLDVDVDKLAEHASVEQVIDLIRCGVFLDSENNSLSMFV